MKKYLISLFVLLSVVVSGVEPIGNIYWVQFNTKNNTPFSLSKPEIYLSPKAIARRNQQSIALDSTDLPVNPMYTDSLQKLGFFVKHTSKWMNGAIAVLDSSLSIDSVFQPSFVSTYEIRKKINLKSRTNKFAESDTLGPKIYGASYQQISMLNGHLLHQVSKGEGVHVAVIDAGFLNTNQISSFDSLFLRNGVLGTYDFVIPGNDVYKEHYHGNAVLSIMAGNSPGNIIGSAPAASYWLLRSEDVSSEWPVEEDYWIIAAEFADSVGCDLINTSLGYSTFDDPKLDHSYNDFNGNSLRISKAANLAAEKGIVVVCSAGNSGNDSWGHIVAPSEAEKVLSVAAVNAMSEIVSFSSRGFSGDGFLPKPDISAMGAGVTFVSTEGDFVTGNGTSFSSPIIAGMAACLISYYPEKTALEIMQIIRSLGDIYPEHSMEYGYGIPDFKAILPTWVSNTFVKNESIVLFPNPFSESINITNPGIFSKLELYTTEGKLVFSCSLENSFNEISSPKLSNLEKGVYFAVIKGDQMVQSLKLIKY